MRACLLAQAALLVLAPACLATTFPIPGASLAEMKEDARLTNELQSRYPDAVLSWREGCVAYALGQSRAAAARFEETRRLAPGWSPATRALAGARMLEGRRQEALALARDAVSMDPVPMNRAGLAMLLATNVAGEPAAAELEEALTLANGAVDDAPKDFLVHAALCLVGAAARSEAAVDRAAVPMAFLARADAWTIGCDARRARLSGARQFEASANREFEVLAQATRADWAYARKSLAAAEQPIAPSAGSRAETTAGHSNTPSGPSEPRESFGLLSLLEIAGILWLGGLACLFVLGAILSHVALQAAEAPPQGADGHAQGMDASLRRTYAVVLWLSCAYYYVSLPVLALLTLLIGGGLIYAMFAAGRIPVKLLVLVVVLTLVTLWSILKSIFVRGGDDDPGRPLDLGREPRLRALLRDVAHRVGTRSVNAVYLTPGTDIAVMERGGLRRQLAGGGERCLVLGVGVLGGLRLRPFKAILAHEYGHFSNRDTAGGGFALTVRRSLLTMAEGLASGGAAKWYNPVWLFLNAFYRAFLRISQGASRLQEVLADRWAALIYGSGAFEHGLRQVIERSVRFEARFDTAILGMALNRPVANLYAPVEAEAPPDKDVERDVREALNRPASPYDSHPSPSQRVRWVRALAAKGTATAADDDDDVWSVFSNREQIEREMTESLRLLAHALARASGTGE